MRKIVCVCLPTFGALVGLVILIGGIIISFVIVPPIIKRQITETIALDRDGTQQFSLWKSVPVPFLFKVYMYNVTNVEEVQAGGIPSVQAVGPYIYRQYRRKYDIERNWEKHTISYSEHQRYEFADDLSGDLSEEDIVTVLDAKLNGFILYASEFTPVFLRPLNDVIPQIFNNPTSLFVTTTVKEYLFGGTRFCVNQEIGISAVLCELIKATATTTVKPNDDGSLSFSFFLSKNDTRLDSHVFEVKDGSPDILELGKLVKLDGFSRLSAWTENKNLDSPCNAINGTDSAIFPPFIDAPKMDVYNSDICRSVTIHYDGNSIYNGIEGRKYVSKEDMFSSSNHCFCDEARGCYKDGAMDMYPCLGSHVAISYPHFLYADDEYKKGVNGLSPDPNLHSTVAIMEPNTGIPILGTKRVQFNQMLMNVTGITLTENLRTTLMPMLWLEEEFELPGDIIENLNEHLIKKLTLIEIFKWSTIIGGSVMIILFVAIALFVHYKCFLQNKSIFKFK